MRGLSLISVLLIFSCAACVDRITIDTGEPSGYSVVIDGYISDQPGPYTIQVTKGFDLESKLSLKTPIAVKKLLLSDNQGNSEVLSTPSLGVYQTSPSGMQGKVGRVYTLRIELLDGRTYESFPDTLQASGKVDRVYYDFVTNKDTNGAAVYGFDIFFDATAGERSNYHFLWKFVGTYKADTNPELHDEPCGESRCPRPPPCSGYVYSSGALQKVSTCSCCSCWYNIYNNDLILSDGQFVESGSFKAIKATNVALSAWTFMFKVHAEIRQMSLTRQTFEFWKSIKSQKNGSASLFQPLTGKVPSNFTQISGVQVPLEGIFYATSISSNSVFVTRDAVPNTIAIPSPGIPFTNNCKDLFPNATTQKPSFWVE